MRILLCGAALGLAFGMAAQAQTPGDAGPGSVNPPVANPPAASPPAATAAPAAVDASATTSPYKTGAAVKDGQGGMVGAIARVVRTPDGATTVSVTVDGRNVNLPASGLTPSADGGAVSAMSKAQITASTAPPI